MPASNLMSQPIASLILDESKQKWKQEQPPHDDHIIRIDCRNDSVIDIFKMLHWGEVELSGAIGATWVSISTGSATKSYCRSEFIFNWHYHPIGSAVFSFQDWITFLVSSATTSCIFARQSIGIYVKEEHYKREYLAEKLREKWIQLQDKPNILFLQTKHILEEFIGLGLFPEMPDAMVAERLGIHNEYWIDHG